MKTKPMLVIYHANCPDGFASAYLIWKSARIPPCEYHPAYYGEDPPDVTGRKVMLLDFCYPRNIMLDMKKKAAGIACFDHHETAVEECQDIDGLTIDPQWSGCILTYTHLEQIGAAPWTHRPKFLEYIDDRDRGVNRLPGTREVNAAIRSCPYVFEDWDLLVRKDVQVLRHEGAGICRYMDKIIEKCIQNAGEVKIGGHTVLASNCEAPMCAGDVALALAKAGNFGATYYDLKTRRIWELRSDDNFDVSKVAKKYGGGGHMGAAGFHTPINRAAFLQERPQKAAVPTPKSEKKRSKKTR